MNKYLKWGGIAISIPVLLFVILTLLFYFPPFQRWAVNQVTAYASDEMGMQISVGQVRLAFPLDLSLERVKVLQPNDSLPHVNDTVAYIDRLKADVQLCPLLKKQVMIDELTFDQLNVNTAHFIHSARIKGKVGHLSLQAHGIDLGNELVNVDQAILSDARLHIELSDTVPPDTTPSTNFWKINVALLKLYNTDFALHMPGDTMSVAAYFGESKARHTYLDLYKGRYQVSHLDWSGGRLMYDRNFEPRLKGLDYSHLALYDVSLRADSFYYCDSKLDIKLRECSFREKSGLAVNRLHGAFAMDSTRLTLPSMKLQTQAGTNLVVDYNMDMNAFADKSPGKFSVLAKGQLSKRDLLIFAGDNLPPALAGQWPRKPLVVVGDIRGNLRKTHVKNLNLHLPGSFKAQASGFIENLTDTEHLIADLDLHVKTNDMSFVTSMLDRETRKSIRIPRGIGFDGNVKVHGQRYATRFTATQGGGSVRGNIAFDGSKTAYRAQLSARALPLQNFLPHYRLHPFTGNIDAQGAGTDFLSPHTRLAAKANVEKFTYGEYNLDHISAKAVVSRGRVVADVDSRNPLLRGVFNVNALTTGKKLRATVSGDFSHVDLYQLKLLSDPVTVALCTHIDVVSDLKHSHSVRGTISDITIHENNKVHRPQDIELDLLTSRDTTHAIIDCADFQLNMDASGGYEQLLSGGKRFVAELENQLKNKYIDQARLRARLPEARIFLVSGKNNIMGQVLRHYGYHLDNAYMNITSSPVTGLNGLLQVDSLVVDSFQIDTVRFRVSSDNTTISYSAQLRNGKDNPNYIFNALFDGSITERGTYIKTRVYDWNDRLGISIALQGTMEQNGVRLSLFGDDPILGYKRFAVNDSNYIYMSDDRRISANMVLQAADGMGMQIFTNDENLEALQDLTISMHRFDIGEALAMVPYTPDVNGILNGDFHVIQTPTDLSVISSVTVDKMVYEGNPMGNLGSEFTYMPRPDGGHYVDGTLSYNGREVGILTGTYLSKGKGVLDADLDMERMPVELINGFIPDRLIGFKGYAEGSLSIRGALSRPDVNGEVFLDSTVMFSEPYGVELRFANDPVSIKNSRLQFENFEVFAHNDSPLNVQGYFDFSDMERMNMNVRMRAQNYLLVDSKETARSDVYGTAYVNFFGTMSGLLSNLKMRGKLDVLGSTDLKYNLKDSPLTTDNQLEGLVEFVNFKDSTQQAINRPPLTGLNIDLSISVDEGAHMDCYLNADHSNYIDIIGGGDMRLQYNTVDNVRLTGRYTIGSGEMKYSLPVIPLKTFTIEDGSYIEFRGDPMNPALSLRATEQTNANIGSDTNDSRLVQFTTGVVVTKTLQDMGLEFIIDAPEDMTIHNQLQAMSKEERGKIAVTMLTTGMYLADGNTKGFTMNSALSAFLNSQINQISNKALRSLDVSIGVDNSINNSGAIHTDYSFKFAKRFWNNRLKVSIGGKLSSGVDAATQNETFFDNVTLEYRLSPTSNKYLNLFYQRDDYDWLEGNVSKFGGGFIWKRKLDSLKDLFRFNTTENILPPMPADSSKQIMIEK
jgi:hypothetical protein